MLSWLEREALFADQAERFRLAEAQERIEGERATWGSDWDGWEPPERAIGPWPEFVWPVEGWSTIQSPAGWWLTPERRRRRRAEAGAGEARPVGVLPAPATKGPHRGEVQMTPRQFAAHCGVQRATVAGWMSDRQVEVEKLGTEKQSRVLIWSGERERRQARIGTKRQARRTLLDAAPPLAVISRNLFAEGDEHAGIE